MKHKLENGEVIEAFRKEFELHELGKDEFTLCHNNNDNTCDGGISIQKENEEEALLHLKKVEVFITNALNQQRLQIMKDIGKIELSGTIEEKMAQFNYYERILSNLEKGKE